MKMYEYMTICYLDNLYSTVGEAKAEVKVAVDNIDKLARGRKAGS